MPDIRHAHELRRNKQYEEALALYRECWERRPDSSIAAAIVNSLRGLGRFDEAESFYETAEKACPSTPWLKTEHVWTLYGKYIKPIDIGDKDVFMGKAQQIMSMTTDLLPRKLTAFKVTDVLGREVSPDWAAVRAWLELIRDVESESVAVDAGKKLSDKRKWYFKYTKALAKLGEYDLCRAYCQKAHKIFTTAYFFRHRAAKCAKAKGDLETARQEYESLLGVHDEWYVHMDLAEIELAARNFKRAEQHIVTAVLKCKNLNLKVRTFFVWAQILEHIDEPSAWLPLHFYVGFRETHSWPVPEEARALAARCPLPEEERETPLEELQERVEAVARARKETYQPRRQGIVKNLQERFGFIRGDDGADIFFSLTSCKGAHPSLGDRVAFRVKRAYDRRKKRESPEAYDVEVAAE